MYVGNSSSAQSQQDHKIPGPRSAVKGTIPFVNLWKQGELIHSLKFPKNLRTEDFYIGDFGLAMKLGDAVIERGYPPMQFCSPDRLHRQNPVSPATCGATWSIFSRLYRGFPPFHTWLKGGVVSCMVRCLGPLPYECKGLYTHPDGFDSWYDQSKTPDPEHDLAAVIALRRPEVDEMEKRHVHSILSRGLIITQKNV